VRRRLKNELDFQKRRALLSFGEFLYTRLYNQVIKSLGRTAHALVPQRNLYELADPFYRPLARGGEGYLEVGKNIYYQSNKLCHMVLSLKPFGCLPSMQSDGVQSAVVSRYKDMIYLPSKRAEREKSMRTAGFRWHWAKLKQKQKWNFYRRWLAPENASTISGLLRPRTPN